VANTITFQVDKDLGKKPIFLEVKVTRAAKNEASEQQIVLTFPFGMVLEDVIYQLIYAARVLGGNGFDFPRETMTADDDMESMFSDAYSRAVNTWLKARGFEPEPAELIHAMAHDGLVPPPGSDELR
jgi:hypothetical protein